MPKAPRNRTITLLESEKAKYQDDLLHTDAPATTEQILNKIINQNFLKAADFLPDGFVDLLFIDPPYNITKSFNGNTFEKIPQDEYEKWMEGWLKKMLRLLKPTASIYICGDWRSSAAVQRLCEKYFIIRNRITFEREKGRGAKNNWKNNSEDIWFCTVSDNYTFNADAVKLKRRVLAPYRKNDTPKDWQQEQDGNFRLTFPSNIWTDITIPFWSMPENTPHPTQKPEKLLAKIILASSNVGDVILDPFAGVGTTGVVAKKLNRNSVMVEIDREYCIYAQKRLKLAENDPEIQGYRDGVFWERNTLREQKSSAFCT
jgi:site-specific DNA-methyltransferase (adenine-specific)